MRKILIFIFGFLLLCSIIFAQSQESQRKNYSESIPYTPRKIANKQSKSQKDKSNKNNNSTKNQPQSVDDEPQKTFENKSINIPIAVSDANGQPVKDLGKADFKVFINDLEREISSFSIDEQPLNLILILDTSPSTAYKIEDIKIFAAKAAEILQTQDKIQLIEFNGKVNVLTELTNDRQVINNAIKEIKMGAGTSIYEAIKYIYRKQINLLEGRKTVVLLTDAVDTTSRTADYETSLAEAAKSDAVVFPFYLDTYEQNSKNPDVIQSILGVINFPALRNRSGSSKADYELGQQYLVDLASLSGGRAIQVKNFSLINKSVLENTLNLLKPRYFISVNTENTDNLQEHKQIRVRVNRSNLNVQARGSYQAEKSN
jgi:VWFA-related protein